MYTTQMDAARQGIITPQMKIVAGKGAHGRGGNPQSGCKGAGYYSLQQEP